MFAPLFPEGMHVYWSERRDSNPYDEVRCTLILDHRVPLMRPWRLHAYVNRLQTGAVRSPDNIYLISLVIAIVDSATLDSAVRNFCRSAPVAFDT